jgi:hypothetical protein
VLANLVHPHIAFAWEFGEAEGRYFVVTRYIDGASLDKVLKERGKLPWKETQLILEQIGSALDFAHRKHIIHRDIKPANIMPGSEDGAVLTDFGLAKALESTGLTTSSGAFLGTPAYIPPEIWLGQEAGPAADQYALACVVGEMLNGQVLFPGSAPPAVMTRHVISGPEFPKAWPEDAPPEITSILKRALEKEPDQRYSDVMEFVTAFKIVESKYLVDSAPSKKNELSSTFNLMESQLQVALAPNEKLVIIPKLDSSSEDVTLLQWLIAEGQSVHAGDDLAEVETDKAIIVIDSSFDGIVARHLVKETDVVAVGRPIAIISVPGEQIPNDHRGGELVASKVITHREETKQEVKASPLATRLARDKGIELDTITGTGLAGRIMRKDVESALSLLDNPPGIEWVNIPAGEFLYGDEKKTVYIRKPYLIGKYPVTNAQYKRFLGAAHIGS